MTIITTMAALKTYVYTSGNELIYLQGYASLDDGGQGFFQWEASNTLPANYGTIVDVSGGATGRWKRVYDGPINARWFGAAGNGTTDDQLAISAALLAALTYTADLFIPDGTYSLNSYASSSNILSPPSGSSGNPFAIRIFGEKHTKLTTALYGTGTNNTFLYFFSGYANCIIENIFFENTHPAATNIGQTTGIRMDGSNSVNNKNFTIQNCTFEGFSNAISLTGTADTKVLNCAFNAPKGRDNGMGVGHSPSVFIWFVSSTAPSPNNRVVINPTVSGCYANGYSGTAAITTLVSQAPMDGFTYGSLVGGLITGNIVKNCGTELILFEVYAGGSPAAPATQPVVISNNLLDCTLPAGSSSVGSPGTLSTGNVGIRCEAGCSVITDNVIYSATVGILQTSLGIITEEYIYKHWQVTNNVIYITTDSTMSPTKGIKLEGNDSSTNAQNPTISGNLVLLDGVTLQHEFDAYQLSQTDGADCINNLLVAKNITKGSNPLYFFSLAAATNTYLRNNVLNGQVDKKINPSSSTWTDYDVFTDPKITTIATAGATSVTADLTTVLADATAGSITLNLPAPSDLSVFLNGLGKRFTFRNQTPSGTNTVKLQTPSGNIIDLPPAVPATSLIIASSTILELQTDGTNWYVV